VDGNRFKANCGSDENLSVARRDDIAAGAKILVKIETQPGTSAGDGINLGAEKAARIVNFESESFAGAHKGIDGGRIGTLNALIR